MPALLEWEKGGSDNGKSITGKSHPGKGVIVEKDAKKPGGSVVEKCSGPRKVEKEAKNPVVMLLTKVLGLEKYLVARRRLLWLKPRTRLLCPWEEVFHFWEVCNFWLM